MATNKTYLPKVDSPEWEELVRAYPTASRQQLEAWAKSLGYNSVDSFVTSMFRRRGIERASPTPALGETVEEAPIVVNLPPVKIKPYRPGRTRKGDEELQGVLSSDEHLGKITNSYNSEIAKQRLETMCNSIITIAKLHRHMYPLKRLWIVKLGDNIQGENPFQGSKLEEVEMGARNQVVKLAVPIWNDMLATLKQHYVEIDVDCFPGNHGQYDRLAPATSNWDLLFYDLLQQGIGQEKGINIHIHDDPSGMAVLEKMGWRFLCLHGDAVPMSQGIPMFAFRRRIQGWHIHFGGFRYVLSAHFHMAWYYEVAAGLDHIGNSTIVSDDPWALKKLGISSKPRQWSFGIHPQKGITWCYNLIVDKKEFTQLVTKGVDSVD